MIRSVEEDYCIWPDRSLYAIKIDLCPGTTIFSNTYTVCFPMHFSLHILHLVSLFVLFSCISGSILDLTSDLPVTAGPYCKLHDVIECAPERGENLDIHACYKALQTMPDGPRLSQFVSRKSCT